VNLTLILLLDAVIWCTFNLIIRALARREMGQNRKRIAPVDLIDQRR
jgi:hypothetical protein